MSAGCPHPFQKSPKTPKNYNITNYFGDIINSQIQEGAYNSTQRIERHLDLSQIQEIIDLLQLKNNDLGLSSEKLAELESEINTIKVQIESPKPKTKHHRRKLTINQKYSGKCRKQYCRSDVTKKNLWSMGVTIPNLYCE